MLSEYTKINSRIVQHWEMINAVRRYSEKERSAFFLNSSRKMVKRPHRILALKKKSIHSSMG
jgi:hypothetical protein